MNHKANLEAAGLSDVERDPETDGGWRGAAADMQQATMARAILASQHYDVSIASAEPGEQIWVYAAPPVSVADLQSAEGVVAAAIGVQVDEITSERTSIDRWLVRHHGRRVATIDRTLQVATERDPARWTVTVEVATRAQIVALRSHAVNEITRAIARDGITLTPSEADELGESTLAWMRTRLEMRVTETDSGVVCRRSEMDTAEIESLRTFALEHNEVAFAHLCTEARLQIENPIGEQWAWERIATTMGEWCAAPCDAARVLDAIRATDTTRPDGSIARRIEV